ncbi:MAG: glycosyltransferase, partial [bacterium]|nr:glycosyltransferase [bacterium]
PVIGIVARLVREKGYFELFEAMQKVVAKFPNAVLLAVGFAEPEKGDAFKPEIAREYGIWGNTKFLGARMDVDELLPLMDIFTLPSWREGIGTSILEASAMARPVVATDVRGCREAVEHRVTGLLVPYRNSKKLGEALLWMLEHPQEARRMGEASRKKIEREFDQELVFERLDREYKRLVEKKLGR